MYIECDHCSTGYELELPPAALSGGRSVKFRCTACGHSFHVVRDGAAVASTPRTEVASSGSSPESADAPDGKPDHPVTAAPSASDAAAATLPSEAQSATIQHVLLRQDGVSYHVPDVSTLQRWIVERRVLPSDELDFGGGKWVQAGDRPDLAPFFAIVSEVESVTRKLAAIAEPVAEEPPLEERDAHGAYEAMPTETPADAPSAEATPVDVSEMADPPPADVASGSDGAAPAEVAPDPSGHPSNAQEPGWSVAADDPSIADLFNDEPDDLPPTEEASRAQVESLLAPRDVPRDMASMWDDTPSAEDGGLPFDWSETEDASHQGEANQGWSQPTAAPGSEGPSKALADLIPRGLVDEDGPSAEDSLGPALLAEEPEAADAFASEAAPVAPPAEDVADGPDGTPSAVDWPAENVEGATATAQSDGAAPQAPAETEPEDLFALAEGWPELDAPSSPLPKLAKTGEMIPFPGTDRAQEEGARGEEDEEVDENAWAEELFAEAPPPGSRPTLEVVEDEVDEEDEGLGLDDPSEADDETEEASSAAIEPEEAGWFAQGGDRVMQAEAVEPPPESRSGVWFFAAVVVVLILGLIWLAQGGGLGFGVAPSGDGATVAGDPNAAGDPAEEGAAGTPAPSKSKSKSKSKADSEAPAKAVPAPASAAETEAAPAPAAPPTEKQPEVPKNPAPPPKAVTAGTFVRRGWGALDRKRYADAEKHFTEALKLRSGLGEAEYGLGYVAQQRGDTTSAKRWLCAARSHAGNDVDLRREIDAGLTSMGASCP